MFGTRLGNWGQPDKFQPLAPVLPDAGVNSSPNRIRNLRHVANFPQIKSRMIAPMIDRMKPAG